MKSINDTKVIRYLIYAVGEIIIITLGIIVALYINNRDAAKKTADTELSTLFEIRNGMRDDLLDIKSSINILKMAISSGEILIKQVQAQSEYTDSMDVHFARLGTYVDFFPRLSPYETLKTRGFDILSNDSIRIKIGYLYDYNYNNIIGFERIATNVINSYNQYLIKNFRNYDFPNSITPVSYHSVIQDNEFENLLLLNLKSRETGLRMYNEIQEEINSLTTQIEAEMMKLN